MPTKRASTPKILIAGGAGFLGSHLCDHYIQRGYQVVCADNLSTGRLTNIAHLRGNKNFSFVKIDITKSVARLRQDYDIVANLASPASPPHYQRLALETLQVGSQGTLHLLELARASNARFFHASTSEVYGDPDVHPQPESYWGKVHCYGPRSMYDESKRYAEALIYSYREKYGLSTCIARFFNTYGPRMEPNDGRVVSNFIVQALQNRSLTIYGDGSQTRSFCYVDDLIDGISRLIDSSESGPMNLGNPSEFTIKGLAEMVLHQLDSNLPITYLPLPGDDPLQRKPVIKLAQTELKWHPKINLDRGLAKTITYFRETLPSTKK